MSDHDITVLNTLIATTIDSADGFEEAAKHVKASGLGSQFTDFASERRGVVTTMQNEVRRLGGTPKEAGTAKAAAHRRWLDLKNAVVGSDAAILQEVENGEAYIRTKYETALEDQGLSEATRLVISQGLDSVRRGHERVRGLNLTVGRSPAMQQQRQGGVDWRRVGIGAAFVAAVSGAAFAASRLVGGRRRRDDADRRQTKSFGDQAQSAAGYAGAERTTSSISSGLAESQPAASAGATGRDTRSDVDRGSVATPSFGQREQGRGIGRDEAAGGDRLAAGGDQTGEGFGYNAPDGRPGSASGSFGATGGSEDPNKR